MKRIALTILAAALFASMLSEPAAAADPPADRVVAMYFHRTQRCPTCLKMGSYSEEAVTGGFAEQVDDGIVVQGQRSCREANGDAYAGTGNPPQEDPRPGDPATEHAHENQGKQGTAQPVNDLVHNREDRSQPTHGKAITLVLLE